MLPGQVIWTIRPERRNDNIALVPNDASITEAVNNAGFASVAALTMSTAGRE